MSRPEASGREHSLMSQSSCSVMDLSRTKLGLLFAPGPPRPFTLNQCENRDFPEIVYTILRGVDGYRPLFVFVSSTSGQESNR